VINCIGTPQPEDLQCKHVSMYIWVAFDSKNSKLNKTDTRNITTENITMKSIVEYTSSVCIGFYFVISILLSVPRVLIYRSCSHHLEYPTFEYS